MRKARRLPAAPVAADPGGGSQVRPPEGSLPGTVVRAYGKFFEVQTDDGPSLLSTVRGSLKRERRKTDLVAPGDRVWVTDVGEGEGQISVVEPRRSVLGRLARLTDDVEQVILANPDQVLFLFALHNPEPHLRMLDRFLVLAESRHIPAMVGVNKVDLDEPEPGGGRSAARARFAPYEPWYPVLYLSSVTGEGVPDLEERLRGKVTAVAGPSGVGKSSLLNRLDPEGRRDVADVSSATGKGRHTTTATILRRVEHEPGTYVADTPGIRALSLQGVEPTELDLWFPEFAACLGRCFYADCTHLHEPGCAVREAVAEGSISAARYEGYAALRRGDADS